MKEITNEELIQMAEEVRKNSLAKLTNYTVGAALLTKSGKIYTGVNIEDEVIPSLSSCAERVTIQNAISGGDTEFLKIAIVGGKSNQKSDESLVPCGVCVQYMLNISKNIDVIIKISNKIITKKLTELISLPYSLESDKL